MRALAFATVLVLLSGNAFRVRAQPAWRCSHRPLPEVKWVQQKHSYEPDTIVVTKTLHNIGNATALHARFTLAYDKKDLELIWPPGNTQDGSSVDIQPGDSSSAYWLVRAKRRLTGDTISVQPNTTFDNCDPDGCSLRFWVPRAGAVLFTKDMTAPSIKTFYALPGYSPMPFDVTLTVANAGGMNTDSVFARIVAPKDLTLYGPDAPDHNTKQVRPGILRPGQEGTVSWTLWHPISMTARDYLVGAWVRAGNSDSSYAEVKIVIPPLDTVVRLSSLSFVHDSLAYNPVSGLYTPDPFEVITTCINRGPRPIYEATAFICLPANVILADHMESQRKAFPTPLISWSSGDSIPELRWLLRYTAKLPHDSYLDFRIVVGGIAPWGMPIDSIETWSRILMPGTGIETAVAGQVPEATLPSLSPAFPNPFRAASSISITLPRETFVYLGIFDALGREVLVLKDATLPRGTNIFQIDGSVLPSGNYTCRLLTAGGCISRPLLLLK
jgi:hypothetical protein